MRIWGFEGYIERGRYMVQLMAARRASRLLDGGGGGAYHMASHTQQH